MDRIIGEALYLGLGLLISAFAFVYALRGVMKRDITVRTQQYRGALAVFWGTLSMCVAAVTLFFIVLRIIEMAQTPP